MDLRFSKNSNYSPELDSTFHDVSKEVMEIVSSGVLKTAPAALHRIILPERRFRNCLMTLTLRSGVFTHDLWILC